MRSFDRIGLAILLFCAFHASAENRVCIGGNLDHLSEAQQGSCRGLADLVRIGTTKFHPPADWHFYVLCTDADWKNYGAFSTRSAQELATLDADTDVRNHVTFLRGGHLLATNVSDLDKILAHEVSSALLGSSDEKLIRRQAAILMRKLDQTRPVLQAAR